MRILIRIHLVGKLFPKKAPNGDRTALCGAVYVDIFVTIRIALYFIRS
ncbi:hypothetical protein ISN45_At02g007480 [Arabidopsis thaliana x Arabidopsis arenosa]|uniref:Uncharacterized protein n=1 Tax=Arabidopsis thaliana x Arabidopsis arenosa TaxID=1240361 RepID=A0A8T2FL28_9BRAS|nr:hypothetical protein ISN45_At02g007480 [Arabidopsis thaliana x Arabidopsis arenosa]